MDFELSDEQRLLVDSVNNFVKKDSPIERFRKQRDVDPGWSKELWGQMGELGWLGTTLVPEPYIPSVLLGGMALCKAGSAQQQERWLAPMIAGTSTLALA